MCAMATRALALAAAIGTTRARSFLSDYVAPPPRVAGAAGAPLVGHVVPQAVADAHGAKCLDGTAPGFYVLLQDPARWTLFIEGGGWVR